MPNADGSLIPQFIGDGGGPEILTNAGNPNGVVIPGEVGQTCIDTTNEVAYVNVDGTINGWQATTP